MDELLDINEPLRWVDTRCRWVGGLLLLLGLCAAVVAPFVDVRLVPACAAALSVVHHAVLPWIGRRFAKRLRTLSAARVLAGRPPLPEVAVPRLTGWAAVPVHLATALLVCTAVDAPAVKEVAHALAGGVGGVTAIYAATVYTTGLRLRAAVQREVDPPWTS